MEKKIITENLVKEIMENILLEEASKVSRQDFNRVQFKIEEFENLLKETKKELLKLENSIPGGLKNISLNKLSSISSDILKIQKTLSQFKDKVRQVKKTIYSNKIEEKKL